MLAYSSLATAFHRIGEFETFLTEIKQFLNRIADATLIIGRTPSSLRCGLPLPCYILYIFRRNFWEQSKSKYISIGVLSHKNHLQNRFAMLNISNCR